MPRGNPRSKVVAIRLTEEEAARLESHGRTPGGAVRSLLDVADEHDACAPPPKTKPPARPKPATASTRQAPAFPLPTAGLRPQHTIIRPDGSRFVTTNAALAAAALAAGGTRA